VLNLNADESAGLAARLRTEQIAWITTVTPEGQPQASPVWFLWNENENEGDGEFLVYAQPRSWKVRNISANPRVALTLSEGDHGDGASFECTARITEGHPPSDEVPAYVEKYRDGIAGIGMTPEQLAAEYATVLLITPARVRVF